MILKFSFTVVHILLFEFILIKLPRVVFVFLSVHILKSEARLWSRLTGHQALPVHAYTAISAQASLRSTCFLAYFYVFGALLLYSRNIISSGTMILTDTSSTLVKSINGTDLNKWVLLKWRGDMNYMNNKYDSNRNTKEKKIEKYRERSRKTYQFRRMAIYCV